MLHLHLVLHKHIVLHLLLVHHVVLHLLGLDLRLHFTEFLAFQTLVGLRSLAFASFLRVVRDAARLFPLGSQVLKHGRVAVDLRCDLLAALSTERAWKDG